MTIHAYTETSGSTPAYINLSAHAAHPGSAVVTVRSAGAAVASAINLAPEQLRALANDIGKHLDAGVRTDMDFGGALLALKAGKRVARAGWNGKGMWLCLGAGHRNLPADQFWNEHTRAFAEQNGGAAPVLPYIVMKTATGEILMGWLASQSDMLAEDWQIVE